MAERSVLSLDDVDRERMIYSWCPPRAPRWEDSRHAKACHHCRNKLKKKRHNCRVCGHVYCSLCTQKLDLPKRFRKKGKSGPVRVCFGCRDDGIDRRWKEEGRRVDVRPRARLYNLTPAMEATAQYADADEDWDSDLYDAIHEPIEAAIRQGSEPAGVVLLAPRDWSRPGSRTGCWMCSELLPSHPYNCRVCGELLCGGCTTKEEVAFSFRKKGKRGPQRVCHSCRWLLKGGAEMRDLDPFEDRAPSVNHFIYPPEHLMPLPRGLRRHRLPYKATRATMPLNAGTPSALLIKGLRSRSASRRSVSHSRNSSSLSDRPPAVSAPTSNGSTKASASANEGSSDVESAFGTVASPVASTDSGSGGGAFDFDISGGVQTTEKKPPARASILNMDWSGVDAAQQRMRSKPSGGRKSVYTMPRCARPARAGVSTKKARKSVVESFDVQSIRAFCIEERELGRALKRGGDRTQPWRERRWTVQKGVLKYHKGKRLRGAVCLSDATVGRAMRGETGVDRPFCINVCAVIPSQRKYLIALPDEEQVRLWIMTIENHIKLCRIAPDEVFWNDEWGRMDH
ncbi:MAG: hypothetical protein MHM6MM_001326 [Cercozoa sp. M6MM]